MTRSENFRFVAALPVIFAALVCGCATTAPSRFYTLSPVMETRVQADAASVRTGFNVGVGPVDIPDYLERPNIVTRTGGNELAVAEYDRWAGSLRQDIGRVLIENLSAVLPPGTSVLSWKRNIPVDYRVAVETTRLDVTPGSEVVLEAQWAIFGKDRKVPLRLRTRTFTEALKNNDYDSAVSGISRVVGRLSEDIGSDVAALSAGHENQVK